MYIPRNLVASYNLKDKEILTERWSSQEGNRAYKVVVDLIRHGANEDFLLDPFERGELKILENICDLKGIQLAGKFILKEGSNFEGIDFSYAKFWNSEIENATFICTFRFSNFYNCKFVNCIFSFSNFFSSHFENVEFIDCEFLDRNEIANCDFKNTIFKNCFLGKNSNISDCFFNNQVEIIDLRFKANKKHEFLPDDSLGDFYSAISLAYLAGGASVLSEDYYYKSRSAITRYNTSNYGTKFQQYLEECLTGYGTMPFRVLSIFIVIYFIAVLVYCTKLNFNDSLVFAAGALLTFGGFSEHLNSMGLGFRLFYILLSFCGISLTALFMTTLAAKWLNKR